MNQIYPDDGLVMLLQRIIDNTLRFHLFVNNVNPDRSFTIASFTEASWTGYAVIDQTSTEMNITGVVGHKGFVMGLPISFGNSSGGDQFAYGYYVTDTSNTKLMFAARFDSAPITKPTGDTFTVVPIIGDLSSLSS